MSDQQPSTGSNDKIENLKPSWIVRCVAEAKRYFYEYQSKKKNESPQDRFSRRTANATLWIAILTFVTIIVGIFQFIVFRGQLTAMKEQLAEMKSTGRQTDDLISANKNLVEVAHGQLEVMHGQLNQMRSALAEQKLTDLLLTRGILTFDPNSWEMNGAKEGNGVNAISTTGMQAISFILKNTGKNPVYIMQSSYEYVISDKLPPVDVDQNTGELRFIGTSPIRISDIPSLFGEESSVRLVIPNLPAISEAGKIAITEGKEHAYSRIVIFYLDQFNWRY